MTDMWVKVTVWIFKKNSYFVENGKFFNKFNENDLHFNRSFNKACRPEIISGSEGRIWEKPPAAKFCTGLTFV